MEKNQPIFVEFYNLHLECGFEFYQEITLEESQKNIGKFWILQDGIFILSNEHQSYPYPCWRFFSFPYGHKLIVKKITPASEDDKNKIINFFSKYEPEVTAYSTAKDIQEKGIIELKPGTLGNLGLYELNQEVNWFESQDFLQFMFDYYCFRQLIDGYITKEIPTWTLGWIQEKIQQYRYSLRIWKDDELIDPIALSGNISISTLNFKRWGINIKGLIYGLDLAGLFASIHLQVAQLLEGNIKIKRCEYNGCNNILYVNHRNRRYCFDPECEAKRSAKSSRKSDNAIRELTRKRLVRAIDRLLTQEEIESGFHPASYFTDFETMPNITPRQFGSYISGERVKRLLRKKRIELTTKKPRNKKKYQFCRNTLTEKITI